jgi:hypothetical protein
VPVDRLTSLELAELGSLVSTLDCGKVRLYRSSTRGLPRLLRGLVLGLSGNRAVALGNHVFLPDHCHGDLPLLAHELTHCMQYQSWGPALYFTRGVVAQCRHLLHRTLRIGSSPYQYSLEPGKTFHAYGMEQQGQIVEDCFRGHPKAVAISPFQPGQETQSQVFPSA